MVPTGQGKNHDGTVVEGGVLGAWGRIPKERVVYFVDMDSGSGGSTLTYQQLQRCLGQLIAYLRIHRRDFIYKYIPASTHPFQPISRFLTAGDFQTHPRACMLGFVEKKRCAWYHGTIYQVIGVRNHIDSPIASCNWLRRFGVSV